MSAPELCPACGAEVPRGARACPECGSDETTGWSERAQYDNLGIPDEESFSYEEFVKREFGEEEPQRKGQTLWIVAGVILLLAFAWVFLVPLF